MTTRRYANRENKYYINLKGNSLRRFNMEEKFKSLKINGLFYEIGSNGTVIGSSGKVLSQREDKDGYMRVTVGTQENRTVIRVHRLVAICHVDNPNPKDFNEVNHLDYNRKNNNYKNLQWTTHLDNIKYSCDNINKVTSLRQRGEGNIKAKLNKQVVIELRDLYDNNIYTIQELSNIYNSKWSTVNNVVKRLTWKHIK